MLLRRGRYPTGCYTGTASRYGEGTQMIDVAPGGRSPTGCYTDMASRYGGGTQMSGVILHRLPALDASGEADDRPSPWATAMRWALVGSVAAVTVVALWELPEVCFCFLLNFKCRIM